jgi:hypothetical protein
MLKESEVDVLNVKLHSLLCKFCYAEIADVGHVSAHAPQSMQESASIS